MRGRALAVSAFAFVGTAYGQDGSSTPKVVATGGEDLKMSYVRYSEAWMPDFATGVSKKGKVTGSVQVGNLLPEPLAYARVVLVIDSMWGKATAPLDARFDPPIEVGDIGTTQVKGVADLSKIRSLDYVTTSMYVDEARGEVRSVSFGGVGDTKASVTVDVSSVTLSAQTVYRGIDGSSSLGTTSEDPFTAYLQAGASTTPTYADTLTGTTTVNVVNSSDKPIVGVHVGFKAGGATVAFVANDAFVRFDPPLGVGVARGVEVTVGANLSRSTPGAYFADHVYDTFAYDPLAATEPAPVVLQKATPLMDAPKKGAKLEKLAKKDTVVELGTPSKGMVEVRAADGQTGWIKASALDAKVKLPGSKKTAKHKGRKAEAGTYLAACDLAKVKGVKVRVDADAYVVMHGGYTARFVVGAAMAQAGKSDAPLPVVPIELPTYGDLKCPYVPAEFVKDNLF